METIIKTLTPDFTNFQLFNITRKGDCFVVTSGHKSGIIVTPVIHPTLASEFLGMDVIGQGLEIAVKGKELYFAVNYDNSWCASPEPEYQSVFEIQAGLPSWTGPIQLLIKLKPASWFQSLKIGYQVVRNLKEYLLEVAFPEKLKIPIFFERSALVSDDGWGVELPIGFNSQSFQKISVKPFDGPKVVGEYVTMLNRIELSQELMPNIPVQIIFSYIPDVFYVRDQLIGQTTSIPFVEIRFLEERNVHRPDWGQGLGGGAIDRPEKVRDLRIRVRCVAYTEGDVGNIVEQMRQYLAQNGDLYLPPFDLTFGIQADRLTTHETESLSISQDLPSVTFDVTIKNV